MERFDWAEIYERLSGQSASLGVEGLEQLAQAALLLGRTQESVDALTHSFQMRLDAGEPVPAIRSAFWAAFQFLNGGDFAQGAGWIARLRKVAEAEPADSVGQAYALAQLAFKQTALDNDYARGRDTAAAAVSIAKRTHEADLVALALTVVGRASLRLGEVRDGLARLDEAMLEISEGSVSLHATGAAYCTAIDACQEVFDLRRAREWTEALTSFCAGQPGMLTFSGQCLVHRSAIHQLRGDWPAALADAEEACLRFQVADTFASGFGWYRLAEVQRALGQWNAAEASYLQASEFGEDPQPGLGLLWLHQGKARIALAAVERALIEARDLCRQARFLPALVEIALAVGEIEKARTAATSLAGVASVYQMPMLAALSANANGAVRLAEGDVTRALPELRESQQHWRRLEAPFEEARVRLLIATACRLVGDDESADLEEAAARRVFESVGAVDSGPPAAVNKQGLTGRELEVLNLLVSGRSNRAIADELFLAVRTVDRHVSNILTKLGVSSRTAAASYAYTHGLVRNG